jgi:hypothetical protein
MPRPDPGVLNISQITPINPGPYEFKAPSREPPAPSSSIASATAVATTSRPAGAHHTSQAAPGSPYALCPSASRSTSLVWPEPKVTYSASVRWSLRIRRSVLCAIAAPWSARRP